jgi:eukaryotic-like serine/threonine-protein kinase
MDNNLVGQTIQGRYYVVKQLGRGGVGVTFLAQDQQCFDSQCVVKQLKPKTTNPQTLTIARKLFNREAEIMNRLGHCDRIPRLLAYFEQDHEFFLVQELIEGHDLSQEIVSGQPWSEAKTLAMLKDVLEVLLIVQQNSVIHRDLKPSNLMRRRQDNRIILIDFGSVKQVSTQIIDAAGQVKQTVAVGTKSYMPMEQMMGRPGFYSDIYALGVIAIQALTGVEPRELPVDDDGEIIWRRKLNPRVHYQPRFLDLLDQMVRYRHQERYASAGAVLADLKQLDAAQNNDKETQIIPKTKPEVATAQSLPSSNIPGESVVLFPPVPPQNNKLATPIPVVSNTNGVPPTSNALVSLVPKPALSRKTKRPSKSPRSKFKILPQVFPQTLSKIFPWFLGLLAMVMGLGGWFVIKQPTERPKIKMSLYANYNQGFRVDYPQNWSKENRDDFWATGVVFSSPLENDADQFKEQVSVLVEDLPQNLALAEYTEQSLAEIKQLSDPTIGQAQSITMGANEGRQIVYHGEENGNTVQRMQTWSVSENRAYVITYTAIPESYDDYLPTVEKIIKSFETIN